MAKSKDGSKGQGEKGGKGGKSAAAASGVALRGGAKREKLVLKKGQSRKQARLARHPKYVDCVVTCGCGNVIHTRSTVSKMNIEVCSACHPFYSGQQKFLDTAGRVEKFQRKYNWKDGKIQAAPAKKKKRPRPVPAPDGD